MRLDEWQKWLDSQFLDSSPDEPSAPAQTSSGTVEEPFATVPVEAGLPTIDDAGAVEPQAERSVTTMETDTTELPPVQQPVATARRAQTGEMDVPSIEQYLPYLRQRAEIPAVPVESPNAPAEVSSEPERGMVNGNAPVPVAEGPDAGISATQSAEAPGVSGPGPVELASAPAASPVTVPPLRAQPSALRRGKQARNVRSKEVAQVFAPEMLWSLVPKHIQVLVAMGSEEVAQNSYKRSFKESRIELISQILDPTLSLEDTARVLNVCPTTVRRYTNRGLLTHHRTPGDQRRFKLSDVLAFLEAQSSGEPAELRDV